MMGVPTLADLEGWIASPDENAHLEFKEAKTQFNTTNVYEYCVAHANEGGGHLVLGVTDKRPREVCGTGAFKDCQDISEKIFNKLKFRVDVVELTHERGRVVVFCIPSRPKGTAYSLEGRYLMRAGEMLVSMSEDQLRKIFDEAKEEWVLRPAKKGCSASDVIALLDTQSYFELTEAAYPTTQQAVLHRLAEEELIVQSAGAWTITNLGAILFAKRLADFEGLGPKALRVVRYAGTNKLETKLHLPGSKGYAVGFAGLLDFVMGQISTNEVIEHALRKKVKMFPEIALRELIANALVHQDFQEQGSSAMVDIYDDRIEISNPGEPQVETTRFIDSYRARNEKLSDLMRRLRICEKQGSGIDKVIHHVEVMQLPAPDFRISDGRTIAVLFAHKPFDKMNGAERIRAAYQHCALRYVSSERMTNKSLRDRFKLAETKSETISRVIRDTVEAGLVRADEPAGNSKKFAKYVPFWI